MYDVKVIDIEIHDFLRTSTLSDGSAKNYRHYISMFYWYCTDKGVDTRIADKLTIADWVATKNWSSSAKYYAVSAVKAFYRNKYGDTHPILETKIRREDAGPQRTLDETELTTLLSSIDTSTTIGIRNLAIISLMVDTGLRATEVCNVDMRKMDLKNNRLNVKIKGGRWGEAVFFEYTAHCIAQWLAQRPYISDPDCMFLFVSTGGKTPGKKMTRHGLRMLMDRMCGKAGIDHFAPHALRRTFATLATENGAPSRLVQLAGRWNDIRMVETYTRVLKPEKIKPFSVMNKLMGVTSESD